MGFTPATIRTPINPFSDFLDVSQNGGKWEQDPNVPSDFTKRAVIAISAGNFTISPTSPNSTVAAARGLTASGLYGLLKIVDTAKVPGTLLFPGLSNDRRTARDLTTDTFVYDTPADFINHLNSIHNNINNIIRQFIPASSWNSVDVELVPEAPVSSISTTNAFNFVNNIFFPGSYTGNTSTAQLPFPNPTDLEADVVGNGITGAFTTMNTANQEYYLSRTGIEFYTVLTALAYGAKVIVGGNYSMLATFGAAPAMTNIDAFITLDMSTYLDGQGITSASSDSRLVYGGSENAYALGNTFNYAHGLTAQWLNSIYTEITKRNNLVLSALDDNASPNSASAYIIHAGLSGADISIAQNSVTNTFDDVYRYPGFNGQASLYQNVVNTAGLTAYTLIEEPYLNRLMCVMGKKRRDIKSTNFGHPTTNILRLEIPLVADVAGSIQRAKATNSIYQSSVGSPNSTVLNVDTITPTIISNSSNATKLKQRRVNFYVQGSNGFLLSTDFVGATSQVSLIGDRIGVTSMKRVITQLTQVILDNFVSQNILNDDTNRSTIVTAIKNAINNNSALNASLFTDNTTVVVNQVTSNDTLITVDVTFYPRQASFGSSQLGSSNLVGYTLTVSAS